jgi:hypothetical protein
MEEEFVGHGGLSLGRILDQAILISCFIISFFILKNEKIVVIK